MSSTAGFSVIVSLALTAITLLILYSVIVAAVRRGVREGMSLARQDEREG